MKGTLFAFVVMASLLVSCGAPSATSETPAVEPAPPEGVTPPAPAPDVVLFICDTRFTDVSLSPSFRWGENPEAGAYDFLLARDAEFANIVVSKTGLNSLPTTTYKCERELNYDTTYYWRVRAINYDGAGEWVHGAFTTIPGPGSPVTAPPLPAIIAAPPEIIPLLPTVLGIKENLEAYRVEVGMVLEEDFSFDEDYYANFVRVFWCRQILVTDRKIVYDRGMTGDDYFILLCYPTTDPESDAVGICFEHDLILGTDTVIALFSNDIRSCIKSFGGTPGTEEKGWQH